MEERITVEVEKYRPVSNLSYEVTTGREFVWTIQARKADPKVRLRFAANGQMLFPVCKIIESKKEYQVVPEWRIVNMNYHGKCLYETTFELNSVPADAIVRITSAVDDVGSPPTKANLGTIFSLILLLRYFGADPDWLELEGQYVEYTLPKGSSIIGSNPDYRRLTSKDGRPRVAFYLEKQRTASSHIVISVPSVLYLFLAYFVAQLVFGVLVFLLVTGWLNTGNSLVVGAPTAILAIAGQIYAVRNAREAFYGAVSAWLLPFIAAVGSTQLAIEFSVAPIVTAILGLATFSYQERRAKHDMNESFRWWAAQMEIKLLERAKIIATSSASST